MAMLTGMLGNSGGGTPTSQAIQNNVAGEIAALTQVTAASADHVMIEDASDSNNKKRVTAGSIADLAASALPFYSARPSYMGAASAYDDEFTTDTSANYTFSPTVSGSAVDPYATVATNPRVSWAGVRSTCLTVQPADATSCFMYRSITLDANCWLWARVTVEGAASRAVSATDCTNFIFGLGAEPNLTGHYVYVMLGTTESGGTDYASLAFRNHTAGSGAIGNNIVQVNNTGLAIMTQAFIQKVADVYYCFSAGDEGCWRYHGSVTYSGNTLDNLFIRFYDDGGVPGSTLLNLDFIRYGTGIVIRP
jgi:hypothetical protein